MKCLHLFDHLDRLYFILKVEQHENICCIWYVNNFFWMIDKQMGDLNSNCCLDFVII